MFFKGRAIRLSVGVCIERMLTPTTAAVTSIAATKRLAIPAWFLFIRAPHKWEFPYCQEQRFSVPAVKRIIEQDFLSSKALTNQSSLAAPAAARFIQNPERAVYFGASEAMILSKRGSPRSGSQKG